MRTRSNIETRIVAILEGVVPIVAYMDDADTLPYVCYLVRSDEPNMVKCGEITSWKTGLSILICADSKVWADGTADDIIQAISAARSSDFSAKLLSRVAERAEDAWVIEIDYEIITK